MRSLEISTEIWIFLGISVVLSGVFLFKTTGEHTKPGGPPRKTPVSAMAPGKSVKLGLTVISADAEGLNCASNAKVGKARCAYDEAGKQLSATDLKALGSKETIRPYMTVDNVFLLVAGLWDEPAIAKRRARDVTRKVPRGKQQRFTANCDFVVEKKLEGKFRVRWNSHARFGSPPGNHVPWVGRVKNCKVFP